MLLIDYGRLEALLTDFISNPERTSIRGRFVL